MESIDHTERRRHKRTRLEQVVIGIIECEATITTGMITDISLGGVNFFHELTSNDSVNFFHSIDLISESISLNNIPCECAWKFKEHKESHFNLTKLEHCGIQFCELSPNQVVLLRNFLDYIGM